jgi:pimeloyl-ACP methyl ester carboxylesterase
VSNAEDALALLRALHAVPAVLIGRSYGAEVALTFLDKVLAGR